MAVFLSPGLAKAWHSLADWALEVGDASMADASDATTFKPVQEELEVLQSVVAGSGLEPAEWASLVDLVHRVKLGPGDGVGVDDVMAKALNDLPFSVANVDLVVQFWKGVRARGVFYHQLAFDSYCQFLSKVGFEAAEKIVSATLKATGLVVKYVYDLGHSPWRPYQVALEAIPTGHWRKIVPQLFSRLNHPARLVRTTISSLLCTIAADYPHLIIYPAVVGSMSRDKVSVATSNGQEDEGLDEGSGQVPEQLQSAHAQIVDFMSKSTSGANSIGQVTKVVFELQRISLLWDELWVGRLQQYSGEIGRRVKRMEDEVKKLADNKDLCQEEKDTLVKEKYNIVFKPILFILDKVWQRVEYF